MEENEVHIMETLVRLSSSVSSVFTDDTTQAIHQPWGLHDTQVLMETIISIIGGSLALLLSLVL